MRGGLNQKEIQSDTNAFETNERAIELTVCLLVCQDLLSGD